MQLTALASLVLALALAHIGVVMGSPPTLLQPRAECSLVCVDDAQCVDCPYDVRYTCVVAGAPGSVGVRLSRGLWEEVTYD